MSAHSLAPRVLGLAVGIATAACPTVALAQTGACCFPDDICFDGVDGTDCLLVDGRFLGDGLTCNGDPDGDSVFGCYDGCPLDREKDDPGVCGCGVPDDDSDADGVFDCVDLCPGTPPGMPVDESGCPPLGACCFLVGVCIDDTLPDDCFAVGGVHQGAGSTCGQECRFPGDGDVDGSGLVDLGDFWYWDPCATGPLPGPLTEVCRSLDLNGDRAVDLADFAQFQRISFTCTHDGGCGDGDVCPETEECDDGYTDACGTCNADCTGPGTGSTCGDGIVCPETEACDDGYTDACGSCNVNCTAPGIGSTCGDGVVCPETEVCDDGGTDDCGPCKATCAGPGTGSVCGDGILCPDTEACDDGFTDACGTCNINCTGPGIGSTCGDGVVCPETEACDDGGTDDCGPCNATCTGPGTGSTCGDVVLCPDTEVCDDGFTDACGTCNINCTGPGIGSTCGDGVICPETEECDDGGTYDADGCSSTCAVESGWECIGEPSVCTVTCSATPDCDDVLFCNGAETCVNEMCQDGAAPCIDQAHCDEDNDLCLDCISNGECDDGDLCTEDECIDNECQYTDKECPQGDYCNPTTGTCVECLSADHCDDDNKCTIDSCDLNVCQHTDVNCGAGLVCDPDTGDCVECLVADHCDDGDLCTEDNCVDKVCENNPKQCGPNEECDPATGQCVTVCDLNEDCDDGLFCNGQEVCVERRCTTLDPPCIDDDHCDEENDVCLECLSADECDDGDLCTNDACIDNDCWNIDVQCAPGVCNPDTGECVDCLVNADCQNGLFCDGDEGCSPALECQPGEDPCDDGIGCTIDSCDEGNNRCENAATDARCPDNGLFCDGLEYCNPVSDCTSTGDPCDADETCNEELDRCEVEPATWVSTQLLFPGSPGYKAPESHELDGVRYLVVAHLGLSEATLRETWPTATIEVYTTDVPLGVETDMYRVINDLGGGLTETFVQTVTINAFHLSIRGSTATWEFDYIVVDDVDTPLGDSVTSGQFVGSQEGDISGARDEITWTSVDATFQWCDVGVECDTPTPLDWTLGTWTKQE